MISILQEEDTPLGLGDPVLETGLIVGVIVFVVGFLLYLGLRQRQKLRRRQSGR